jgi:hypothetical protein
VKTKDDLIYDLIFSDETIYIINLSEYVSDIYSYEDFVDDVKLVMKKSKVTIIKSTIKVDSKTATWELKVKK